MHIARITISNFRNLKNLSISGLGPTSVVVGENKVGKSNLLHALRLVLDPSLPDSARQLRPEDFWDGVEPFAGGEIRVELDLAGFETEKSVQAVLSDCIVDKKPMTARLTYLFKPKSATRGRPSKVGDYEFVVFGGMDEKHRVGADTRQYISLRVLPALRDADSDLNNWPKSPLRPIITQLDVPVEKLQALADAIKEASAKLLDEPHLKDLDKAIRRRLNDMVGTLLSTETNLGFTAGKPEQVLKAVRLFVDGPAGRALSEASLGTSNLIFLCLLLEGLHRQLMEGQTIETVLAIEEPEAHIHPHIQRLVFRYLLRRDSPLLLTTHSPHVVSVAPLKSLVSMRDRGKDGSVAFSTSGAGLTENEEKDLERYIDVTRAEILFARGVVLVEGATELYVIPAFAKKMGHDFDSLGITVCAVHGIDFSPYRKLLGLKGLCIPNVVITDGDPDDSGVPKSGIKRGCKLIESKDLATRLGELIEKDGFSAAHKLLQNGEVFVGQTTIELDLLEVAGQEIIETYGQLKSNDKAIERFTEVVQRARKGDSKARVEYLERIERVGKGRMAQRLSPRLENTSPPSYIKAAINRIVELVKGNA